MDQPVKGPVQARGTQPLTWSGTAQSGVNHRAIARCDAQSQRGRPRGGRPSGRPKGPASETEVAADGQAGAQSVAGALGQGWVRVLPALTKEGTRGGCPPGFA